MKKRLGLFFVILLSFFMIRPLLGAGYFPMHDDTQIARIVVMGRALRAGQFPVRWVSDLGYGYGYPIFNFYGPLPYYIGGFLYALGMSGLTATKIMMGTGLIMAGITMYLAVADISGIAAGIVSSVFYMYAPYHAVDAYVRGAVGEYYALIFLPLILWGMWKISSKQSVRNGVLLGATGTAGLVLSHTILGYVGIFLELVTLCILLIRSKNMLPVLLLGLGLSAFFWLPAFAEMKYTNVASVVNASANFRDHFVCIGQLWDSPWGFGGSAAGCLDGLSFKIGKAHLLIGLAACIGFVVSYIRRKKQNPMVTIGLIILAVSVFFMLSISQPVWEIIPYFSYIQYPWRFLAFAIFGISLIAGQTVTVVQNRWVQAIIVIISVTVVLFVEAKRFVPQYIYSVADQQFETAEDIRFRVSKISDEYLPPSVPRPAKPQDIVSTIIPPSSMYSDEVVNETDTYVKIAFQSSIQTPVEIFRAYFPGWHYMVNQTEVTPVLDHGIPVLPIPGGDSVVQMRFTNTPVRTIGNMVSLLSLVYCLYLYDQRKQTVS